MMLTYILKPNNRLKKCLRNKPVLTDATTLKCY